MTNRKYYKIIRRFPISGYYVFWNRTVNKEKSVMYQSSCIIKLPKDWKSCALEEKDPHWKTEYKGYIPEKWFSI